MRRPLDRVRALLILAAMLAPAGCATAIRLQPPLTLPGSLEPIKPVPVPDEQVAQAVHQLVLDGGQSVAREALLIGVVRRLFVRAAERFDNGDDARGLATLTGALYLVRVGELRPEMFDASAAHTFERALDVVAPPGDEARSLAFLTMQSGCLPKDSAAQGPILEHLRALQTWLRDTRNRTEVENASADQRTYGELAMVQPTPESLSKGVKAAERWVSASIEFNAGFKPGIDNPKREQLIEAYRGIRTGALVIAAMFLRHGDAAGASKALEGSDARRITPPGLIERLDSAARGTDPIAWRELAALYANAGSGEDDSVNLPREIARGAAWGAMLEAYRRNPHAVETAVPVAEMLLRFGVAEAGISVLAEATRENKNASVTAGMLELVLKFILHEDQARDSMSARRVFGAARPILTMVDALADHQRLDPSPARVRFAMAAVEMRNGDLPAARALLEQGLSEQSTVQAWTLLADILWQAGDTNGALSALTRALSSPDAPASAIARADCHLLALRIHRAQGANDLAKRDLGQALAAAIEARSGPSHASARALAERLLARVAFYYGDRAAVSRAIQRGFEAVGVDRGASGMVAIEASSSALLMGDVTAGRAALTRATQANVDDDDLVYVALWLQLLERQAKEKPSSSEATTKALRSVKSGPSWTSKLAQWGLGKLDDAALVAGARDVSQRTEAAFYVAMRKHVQGDAQALLELERIAKGSAIQLVETHIAQELTAPTGRPPMGQPPATLP